MNAQEESRPGGRRPANQHRSTATNRDGNPSSQQARRGGKSAQNVTRTQDNNPPTSNGPASPAPPQEESSSIPTFNFDEVKKMLEAGVDPNAEVYRPSNPESKPTGPTGPWAPKGGQMANGKDFFVELRKQVTEKLQEREKEEQASKQDSTAKGG